jgi:hypothetical protein
VRNGQVLFFLGLTSSQTSSLTKNLGRSESDRCSGCTANELLVSVNNQQVEIGLGQQLKAAARSRAPAKGVTNRRTSSMSNHDRSFKRSAIERPRRGSAMTKSLDLSKTRREHSKSWNLAPKRVAGLFGAKYHRRVEMSVTPV